MMRLWIRATAFTAQQQSSFLHNTLRQFTLTAPLFLGGTDEDVLSGYKRPRVQWYPGHIAKAERQLSETLKAVDVVVEVRDARACKATSHEKVAEWCAGRPRIVVLTHVDQIPKQSVASWKRSYEIFGAGKWDGQVNAQVVNQAVQKQMERDKYVSYSKNAKFKNDLMVSPVENVLFVDAKKGQGIHGLNRAIFKAGAHVQERRARRGLKDRALRVGIIGYPNVSIMSRHELDKHVVIDSHLLWNYSGWQIGAYKSHPGSKES
jgi:ribosome biogenesis GTPase A